MDVIEVEGLDIAYERVGEGPPLLLLHGGLSDSRMWRRQLDGLSDEFTVIAWDAPGCGQSSDPPETFRLPEFADCLAAFIDRLGFRQTHLLGLSWGSGLALELFGRYPGIPLTLTLTAAYAGWAGSLPPEEVEQRLQKSLRESELPPEQFVPGWLPGLLTDAAPAGLAEELAAIMSDFHPSGSRTMVRAFAEADLRPVLPRIDVPTLLLYGEEDVRSPRTVAEDMHARIPNSTLVFLSGTGHVSNMEMPEQFNAEVRSFLRSAAA